jgi:hypothetical protein
MRDLHFHRLERANVGAAGVDERHQGNFASCVSHVERQPVLVGQREIRRLNWVLDHIASEASRWLHPVAAPAGRQEDPEDCGRKRSNSHCSTPVLSNRQSEDQEEPEESQAKTTAPSTSILIAACLR